MSEDVQTPYDPGEQQPGNVFTALALQLQMIQLELAHLRRDQLAGNILSWYIEDWKGTNQFDQRKKKQERIEAIILAQVTEQASLTMRIAETSRELEALMNKGDDDGDDA